MSTVFQLPIGTLVRIVKDPNTSLEPSGLGEVGEVVKCVRKRINIKCRRCTAEQGVHVVKLLDERYLGRHYGRRYLKLLEEVTTHVRISL